MQDEQGHTLFSFCEELATVCNTNNRGQWSNKRAAYTIAFDGGGQDYHSLDSVSTTVQPGYNWTASGTHGAFDKFFDGDSIDGGLASRVLFAEMPYSLFEPLAKEQQQSAQNIKRKITEAMSRDEEVWVSPRALCQYSTSQRKSPLAGIDSPESERVPLAMMPRKPSSVTL